MNYSLIALILFPALLWWGPEPAPARQPSPEICDNALDDDLDGLIDLQDPDCACGIPPLIPNGSFEASICCPAAPSQDYCIEGWRKATLSTPDFLSACDWEGWPQFPVPLPLPDGQACIGFRNGRFESRIRPEEKEYIGICLRDKPLLPDSTYHFRFFVGFTDGGHSPATGLSFFGTSDCRRMPAGIDTFLMVCPGNEPGWFEIQRVSVSGANTWAAYEFDYTPYEPVAALVIGPECRFASSKLDLYYFFDDLVVEKKRPFPTTIRAVGPACSRQFTLEVVSSNTLRYQWYRDKIALLGETSHRLSVAGRAGSYQAALYYGDECILTPAYEYQAAAPKGEFRAVFCSGEPYLFNGRPISEPGIYFDTLQTKEGCDSIVRLTLAEQFPETDTLKIRIIDGESFQLGGRSFDRPGSYQVRLPAEQGCDSLVRLVLDFLPLFFPNAFSPNNDHVNDRFTLFGGAELVRIVSLSIFDRWGDWVWSGQDLPPNEERSGWDGRRNGRDLPEGLYLYTTTLQLNDGSRRNRSGSVLLLR